MPSGRKKIVFHRRWGGISMFWGKRKKETHVIVDKEGKTPVVRASICTGEKVAGFQDKKTGVFEDVMLINGPDDLDEFRRRYGLGDEEIRTIY